MDGDIASSTTKRPRGYVRFAVLRQRGPRGALGRGRSRRMGRSSGRNLGNELSRIRRQHWADAAFADRTGSAHGVRRIATSYEWPVNCALRRESRRIRRAPYCCASAGRDDARLVGRACVRAGAVAALLVELPQPRVFVAAFREGVGKAQPFGKRGEDRKVIARRADRRDGAVHGNDEVVAPRFHQLVVGVYAGEKRVISLPDAYHNDPIEGTALADLNRALDWLLPKKDN